MVSTPSKPLRVDQVFRALSDPKRRRILQLLRGVKDFNDGRGCCVSFAGGGSRNGRGQHGQRRRPRFGNSGGTGALEAGREICVCDLTSVLGAPQPTVSRHLAYLRRSGLVRQRKAGLWSYYCLAPATNRFHKSLLQCLDACGKEFDDAQRLRARCAAPSTPAAPGAPTTSRGANGTKAACCG